MTPATPSPRADRACPECLRRSWLLVELSASLDRRCGDPLRLLELLSLGDHDLIAALGGSRRAELLERHAAFDDFGAHPRSGATAICRHRRGYPTRLLSPASARLLHLAGGSKGLAELTSAEVVAIAGSSRASDYGRAVGADLARGLAVAGVTVAATPTPGIGAAAIGGALDAGGAAVAVLAGTPAAASRAQLARLVRTGCAISELPWDVPPRRWGHVAALRTLVELASAVIVVEAEESARERLPGVLARAIGRPLGAVPGRVTSPLSAGTHALLRGGATLMRGAQDAIELLFDAGSAPGGVVRLRARLADAPLSSPATGGLDGRLREVLAHVGMGADTPAALAQASGADELDGLLALSELELLGLLGRGDDGRYLPRYPHEGPKGGHLQTKNV